MRAADLDAECDDAPELAAGDRPGAAGRLTNWVRAATRWCILLAAFGLTAEIFARIDDAVTWDVPPWVPYSSDLLTKREPFGIRGRPNYRYQKWGMNDAGFRGPNIATAPASATTRIAVLGASETFGLYESPGKEYPRQLQVTLDSVAPHRFEVVNAGLPGMSLPAMIPYFTHVVAPIRPAVVLIYPSPSFYLEVNPVPLEYQPSPPEPADLAPARPGLGNRAVWHPRLIDRAKDVLKDLIPGPIVTWYRERRLTQERAARGAGWVWTTVPEDRMVLLRHHFNRLFDTIRASGIRAVLVTHTNRFVGPGATVTKDNRRHLINLMSRYYPQASEQVMVAVDSVANEIGRQVARERGITVVEIEGRIPPTSSYFADYAHFTDLGATAMARLIGTEIVSGSDFRSIQAAR